MITLVIELEILFSQMHENIFGKNAIKTRRYFRQVGGNLVCSRMSRPRPVDINVNEIKCEILKSNKNYASVFGCFKVWHSNCPHDNSVPLGLIAISASGHIWTYSTFVYSLVILCIDDDHFVRVHVVPLAKNKWKLSQKVDKPKFWCGDC